MDDWVWWMIAAGVLAIGEIATLGFFLGPIAIAATTAAVVALVGAGLALQWIVFIAVSLASLVVLRPSSPGRSGLPAPTTTTKRSMPVPG
jgi:membrane protein implicated in regulation of membrane protease activity